MLRATDGAPLAVMRVTIAVWLAEAAPRDSRAASPTFGLAPPGGHGGEASKPAGRIRARYIAAWVGRHVPRTPDPFYPTARHILAAHSESISLTGWGWPSFGHQQA